MADLVIWWQKLRDNPPPYNEVSQCCKACLVALIEFNYYHYQCWRARWIWCYPHTCGRRGGGRGGRWGWTLRTGTLWPRWLPSWPTSSRGTLMPFLSAYLGCIIPGSPYSKTTWLHMYSTVKPRYMAPGYMAEPAYMAGDSWGQNPSLPCKTKIFGGWLNGKPRYMAGQATWKYCVCDGKSTKGKGSMLNCFQSSLL